MAEKFTVELKGQGLRDLKQIASLCKEDPERLLARAFREWVELREDLEDLPIIRERSESYDREGGIPHEQVMRELGLAKTTGAKRKQAKRRAATRVSN